MVYKVVNHNRRLCSTVRALLDIPTRRQALSNTTTMHSIIIQWLLAGAVAAVATGKARRQDGPIDPGTAADCTYWETARNSNVGTDCKSLWLDHYVCIGV